MEEFKPFPKIPRLFRHCVITEKIDGTNASIHIGEDGSFRTGSRNRWITPEDDNFAFSKWAHQNKEELLKLGPGAHYGEWYGIGIQRGYGLSERRLALFNTKRWVAAKLGEDNFPKCVEVVPVLYEGVFSTAEVNRCITELRNKGTFLGGGILRTGYASEGVVVYLPAAGQLFKVTCENDEQHKGQI